MNFAPRSNEGTPHSVSRFELHTRVAP